MKLDDFISLIFPEYLWIYTADRNSTLTSEDLQAKVTTLQLDTTSLIDSDQTDCTN